MHIVLPAFAKLNITLSITGRRDDGYHHLVSGFLRIPSGETLTVAESDRDEIELRGLPLKIQGENLVAKALLLAREVLAPGAAQIPPLRVEIRKALCPGSGLGAGSGNAAALLRWLSLGRPQVPWMDVAGRVGADVPFLFSGLPAARVSGIGGQIEPLPLGTLRGLVVIPDWSVDTKEAYAALDRYYEGRYPLDRAAAVKALDFVCDGLGQRPGGVLPNDFLPPLMRLHPQYQELFGLLERMGCAAWGLSGSGSAAFGLLGSDGRGVGQINWPAWVRQVLWF